MTIYNDSSNCKLTYAQGVGIYMRSELLDRFKKKVLEKSRQMVLITVIYDYQLNFLKQNFQLYYAQKVPTGYNGGFQYHVCIRNTHRFGEDGTNANMRPLIKNTNMLDDSDIEENTIEESLEKLFKEKRRKKDIIKDILYIFNHGKK